MTPSVLAVIPARGGSVGVPRKNLAPTGGKPLIAWTIAAALGASGVTRTLVSTDDDEIASTARSLGADVPFRRPAQLATNEAATMDVLVHALDWLRDHEAYVPDLIACLQPTTPLRTAADIDDALGQFAARQADAIVSVTPADRHPLWMKTIDATGRLQPWQPEREMPPRRQDLPPVYALNGALYIARTTTLRARASWYGPATFAFVMPIERSLDVDTPWDLHLADLLLRERE